MYKELEVLLDRYEALAPDDPARVKARADVEPLYLDGAVYGAFTRKYRVRTFPTSMIVNTAGEMLHRSDANGMSTSEFLEWLKTKK